MYCDGLQGVGIVILTGDSGNFIATEPQRHVHRQALNKGLGKPREDPQRKEDANI